MVTKAKWTFMVFMAGDNNLSAAGDKDLAEMRQVGSSTDVNLLVEFDNAGNRGTRRYLVQKNRRHETVVKMGETDSGDPRVLIDFVNWAVDNYPAERYALVLWNHGGGWEPSEMDRISRQVNPTYNEREATVRAASPLRRAFFRTTLETILSLPTVNDRAICSDDGSGHSLDTVELGRVLQVVQEKIGAPLDLLGMDACLMSNLEVAYQAWPYVRYITASEESEPNDGWPYNDILGRLVANPAMPTAELATHIVADYIQFYESTGYTGDVTQAALSLEKIDQLATALDGLAEALIQLLPGAAVQIWNAQRKAMRFWQNTLWDIAQFCEVLEAESGLPELAQAAAGVRTAMAAGADGFVLADQHHGPNVGRCGGVSIYLPALATVSRYYDDLDFAKDHKWAAMIKKYRE
jgi:hypothetical protein